MDLIKKGRKLEQYRPRRLGPQLYVGISMGPRK